MTKQMPIAAESTYAEFLRDIKNIIRTARIRASRTVNSELIEIYWNLGKEIVERQESHGWGNR